MAAPKRVLIICTSAGTLGDIKTGTWMEEVVAPYNIFTQQGFEVVIASIKGGEVPVDEASKGPPFATPDVEAFLADASLMSMLLNSVAFTDVSGADFDAVFLPGGHGVCVDMVNNPALDALLGSMWEAGKVVSAVCHGPNGLVGVKDAEGKPLVAGKKVTGFSNTEEIAVAKEHLVPFMLEDKLVELGGIYSKVDDWGVHAVRDGRLVTGQNPGSSEATAKLIVEVMLE